MDPILASAFVLGLAGTAHCIGMCGPIAMALPLNRSNSFTIWTGILQYNLGRVMMYSILGFVVGMIGISIELIGWLQGLSILSGILIIAYAWRKYIRLPFGNSNGTPDWLYAFITRQMGKFMASKNPLKLFMLGFFNGMLPCGMVYTALIGSLVMAHPVQGAAYMVLYGLGTLPALALIAFSANRISNSFRHKLQRSIPYFMTVIGFLLILRGMNLDIPYLSPKFDKQTNGSIQSNCHSGKTVGCEVRR